PWPGGWLATASVSIRRSQAPASSEVDVFGLQRINRNLWFQSGGGEDALVLAVAKSPFEDDWSGEAAWIVSRSSSRAGGLLAVLERRIDDVQSWRIGLQIFRGRNTTSLGSLRDNSVLVAEWRAALGR